MRARRLLFPCASVVFLIAVPFAAFVFWASQPSTVELPWMRWAFLASAALLLLKLRPALGVVVIDERGVRVRTLFKSAFIPWQDVRQVGKHDGLAAIPKIPAQNIFISRVVSLGEGYVSSKALPLFLAAQGRGIHPGCTQLQKLAALEAAIRHYWPGEWVYLLHESWFPAGESLRRSSSTKRRSPWTMYPSSPQRYGLRAGSRNLTNPPQSSIIGTDPERRCAHATVHGRGQSAQAAEKDHRSGAGHRPHGGRGRALRGRAFADQRRQERPAPRGQVVLEAIYSTACATASNTATRSRPSPILPRPWSALPI